VIRAKKLSYVSQKCNFEFISQSKLNDSLVLVIMLLILRTLNFLSFFDPPSTNWYCDELHNLRNGREKWEEEMNELWKKASKSAELSSYVINYVSYQACDIFKLTQIASYIVSNLLFKRTHHMPLMPLIADYSWLFIFFPSPLLILSPSRAKRMFSPVIDLLVKYLNFFFHHFKVLLELTHVRK
jgi:hypothetical protein